MTNPRLLKMTLLFALMDFAPNWDLLLLPSLLFLPVGMRVSTLCLSHRCILETHNLIDFTGSHLEGNLPQNESYLEPHPHLI